MQLKYKLLILGGLGAVVFAGLVATFVSATDSSTTSWYKINGELGVQHRIIPMALDVGDLPEYGAFEINCPEGTEPAESDEHCVMYAERPNAAPPPGYKNPNDNDTDMKANPYLTEAEQQLEHAAQEAANARGDARLMNDAEILTYVKTILGE